MAAHVLLRLAALTGEGRYRTAAERAIAVVAPLAGALPDGLRQVALGHRPLPVRHRRGRDRRGAGRTRYARAAGRRFGWLPSCPGRGPLARPGVERRPFARGPRPRPRPADRLRLPELHLPGPGHGSRSPRRAAPGAGRSPVNRRPASDAEGGGPLAEPPRPVPAATVVLLRSGPGGLEVLLTRRPATMAFGPDIHVFPGGRVEAADGLPGSAGRCGPLARRRAAANLGLGLALGDELTPQLALAHHVAAVRETVEETGIEIMAADLIALSRWVTPVSLARRFDAPLLRGRGSAGHGDGRASPTRSSMPRGSRPRAALEGRRSRRHRDLAADVRDAPAARGPCRRRAVREAFAPGGVRGGPTIEAVRPRRRSGSTPRGRPGSRAAGPPAGSSGSVRSWSSTRPTRPG